MCPAAADRSDSADATAVRTAIDILRQRFGERLQTGAAVREQHGHTQSWIANEPPDGVVFAESTADVAETRKVIISP